MSDDTVRLRVGLADRIALMAVAGLAASMAVWFVLSWVDALIAGTALDAAMIAPTEQQQIARLSAVVVVLLATLVAQMLYTHRYRAEQLLRHEQAHVRQIYDHSPDSIVSIGRDFRVLYANKQSTECFDRSPAEIVGGMCYSSVACRMEPCSECPLEQVFATGEVHRATFTSWMGGSRRYHEHLFYPVRDANDAIVSVVESVRDTTAVRLAQEALRRSYDELESLVAERTADLTTTNEALEAEIVERQRVAEALSESESRYRHLVESSPDMVLVHREGTIVYLNSAGVRLLGLESPDEALGTCVASLIEPCGTEVPAEAVIRSVTSGELEKPIHLRLHRAEGELVDIELSVATLQYEGEDAVQCTVRDISERVRAQETIQRMAYYDPLTDLPNRALFRDRLRAALAHARRSQEIVAVVFVDLDDFKAINDTLGHGVGDGVLKGVARQIRTVLRDEDTVARQGGDEFTIIARVASRKDASALAKRLLEAISRPVEVDGHSLCVSASIGISTFPNDGEEEVDLIRNADAAMYRAKDWGHNIFRLYTPDMSASAAGRLELEGALRQAISERQFELFYQPQVDVRDGRFVGIEALLRWNHPVRGMLSPSEFMELAEQAGFIADIGYWVLQSACVQAQAWREEGLDFGRVAVNLSAREFVQRNIVENVARALEASGLPASMLELEITETIAMYNMEQILAILHLLRRLGVRVAIDDFGTGYSSMSYLKRFPVQTLKIAQDFMRDVDVDSQSAAIASMLIELCRELGLDIVAEGVENHQQLEFLKQRGCYVIQGYLFSKPVSAAELTDILRDSARRPRTPVLLAAPPAARSNLSVN